MIRDRTPPTTSAAGARRIAMPSALLAAVLGLTGCGSDGEGSEARDTYAAVSSAEDAEHDDGEDTAEDASAGMSESDVDDEAAARLDALSEDEFRELLLEEDELPFESDTYVEESGAEYFHQHIGVTGDTYVTGFGDEECTRQMDGINERLVGQDPQDGLIRQASRATETGEERLYLWMLSYAEAVDTEPLWDDVLDACEGRRLEDGADTIDFSAFAAAGFRGLTMEMGVENGSDVVEMDGYSATRDMGRNLLMISAVNVDAATFEDVLTAQAAKIDARLGR
ncbi:hypothetical protein [Nesterenkonia sp. K-15-9-6]|uniref:hypothetical protein n=1 Tax=Nesterenkonia sp. K-15-9-6 TaxID=3093918 RepID=UPI0040450ED7